jgi:hypothetical protein
MHGNLQGWRKSGNSNIQLNSLKNILKVQMVLKIADT